MNDLSTPSFISEHDRALHAFDRAAGPDESIVAKARALRPMIKANAQASEDGRRVVQASIDALHEQGLFHVSVPKHRGGQGASFRTFIETVAEVGRADGGTGWACCLLNVCTWFATLFSDRAQDEVFNATPRARVCGIFTPAEKGTRVEGGYRVSGMWHYGSGSLHADWGALGIRIGTHADGSPEVGLALIPFTDLTIKDTWYVAGMRASGSNTLVADDIFIPEHRVMRFEDMAAENYSRTYADENNYHASFVPVAAIVLVAAQLGLARAAMDATLGSGARKAVSYTIYNQASQSPPHQIKTAEAMCDIDQAHLLIARACADIDYAASQHQKLELVTRARIRMDTGRAAQLCRGAINMLLSVNGAGSFANVNPLQRIWRDSEVASRHAFVLPEFASFIYGRALFGVPDLVQPF